MAVAADGGGEACLLWRTGAMLCALPAGHVVETMRPLPLTVLPNAPDFIAGMALVRGMPMPVVALDRLWGQTGRAPGRLIVARVGSHQVGLLVDAIIGVRPLPGAMNGMLPPLLRDALGETIAAVGRLDGELLVVLERARLVPPEVFELMETALAAA